MIDASPVTHDQRRHAYCVGAVARLQRDIADPPAGPPAGMSRDRYERLLAFYATDLTRIQWGKDLDGRGRRFCAMMEDASWLTSLEAELQRYLGESPPDV